MYIQMYFDFLEQTKETFLSFIQIHKISAVRLSVYVWVCVRFCVFQDYASWANRHLCVRDQSKHTHNTVHPTEYF